VDSLNFFGLSKIVVIIGCPTDIDCTNLNVVEATLIGSLRDP
jgi:hypothetical protein